MDDLLATEVLHEREARLFLRRLANYDPTHAAAFHMEAGGRIDLTTIDSQVVVYADHLRVNDFFLKSISLKQLPGATAPILFFDLLAIDSDLIVCAEWKLEEQPAHAARDSRQTDRLRFAVYQSRLTRPAWPRRAEVRAASQARGRSAGSRYCRTFGR
jgi:hypothetical protein